MDNRYTGHQAVGDSANEPQRKSYAGVCAADEWTTPQHHYQHHHQEKKADDTESKFVPKARKPSPEELLQGQGAWKPIEIMNLRAAKRALKNSRCCQ